jgi:cellobiose phosphorylase
MDSGKNLHTKTDTYGDFSSNGEEFIVTRAVTPRPWINYLSNGKFCSLISQTAGGTSFYLDSRENRLTRWAPENYLHNTPGFFLYLRDAKGDVFSGTCSPVYNSKFVHARHGLGYTIILTQKDDLECEMTFFTPLKENLTCCIVKLRNSGSTAATYKAYPFIEWLFGDYQLELAIRNISVLYNEGWYDEEKKAIIVRKFPVGNKVSPYLGFFGTSLKTTGWDMDYEVFLGNNGTYAKPEVVVQGQCKNTNVRGKNMVGVFQSELTLAPGQETEFSFFWGMDTSMQGLSTIVEQYRNPEICKKKFSETAAYWKALIPGTSKITTGFDKLDTMMNVWLKYQIVMNNHWGRSATFYHEGHGEFGYRNTAQDAWSIIPIDPVYAKDRINMLAKCQRKSGQPLPGWSAQSGFSTHVPPADFPVWFPMLINSYIKETGEFGFLEHKEKYFDGPAATIYKHAVNGLRFLQDRASGKHKIPLMGTQDWNDAFDRCGIGGKGESVWLGIGLCYALKQMIEIAGFLEDKSTLKECNQRYDEMKKIINKFGWDGNWYLYAFDDKGTPVGSHENEEGKIHLNSQTWAIIAGIADEEKIKKIYDSLEKHLETEFGYLLFAPYYSKFNINLGRITAFAPGTKENAAIFMHGAAFKIYADLLLGNSEKAYKTILQILPNIMDQDIQKTEPYVLPEYRIGRGNADYGQGAFSWLTGSADWLFRSILDLMIGIEPDYKGLKINPHMPSKFSQYKVERRFRGRDYSFEFKNTGKKTRHEPVEVVLNGKKLSSDTITRSQSETKKVNKVQVSY